MEDPSQPPRDAPDRLGINRGPWDNEAWLFCSCQGVAPGGGRGLCRPRVFGDLGAPLAECGLDDQEDAAYDS